MCLIVGVGYLSSEKKVSEGDAKIQLVFDLGLSSAVERHLFARNPDTDRKKLAPFERFWKKHHDGKCA